MRVAVVGSRNLDVDIAKYIPKGTTEIISGGAKGIDRLAEAWADENGIPKLIVRPEYSRYSSGAPLKRNEMIVDAAEMVVAVWDGKSTGTKHTVDYAWKAGKNVKLFLVE